MVGRDATNASVGEVPSAATPQGPSQRLLFIASHLRLPSLRSLRSEEV